MELRKRGGQPGNRNAVGHGAPSGNQNAVGHGAPFGNANAFKHGRYSIYRDSYNRELKLAALNFMDRNHIPLTLANMEICIGILQDLRKVRQGVNYWQSIESSIARAFKDLVRMVGGAKGEQ